MSASTAAHTRPNHTDNMCVPVVPVYVPVNHVPLHGIGEVGSERRRQPLPVHKIGADHVVPVVLAALVKDLRASADGQGGCGDQSDDQGGRARRSKRRSRRAVAAVKARKAAIMGSVQQRGWCDGRGRDGRDGRDRKNGMVGGPPTPSRKRGDDLWTAETLGGYMPPVRKRRA